MCVAPAHDRALVLQWNRCDEFRGPASQRKQRRRRRSRCDSCRQARPAARGGTTRPDVAGADRRGRAKARAPDRDVRPGRGLGESRRPFAGGDDDGTRAAVQQLSSSGCLRREMPRYGAASMHAAEWAQAWLSDRGLRTRLGIFTAGRAGSRGPALSRADALFAQGIGVTPQGVSGTSGDNTPRRALTIGLCKCGTNPESFPDHVRGDVLSPS